jgi:hypothetical protein
MTVSEDQIKKRFMLVITGDGTRHLSAPIQCASVGKVKRELENARMVYAPKRCPGAGMAFVARVIESRVLNDASFSAVLAEGARSQYEKAHIGDHPLLADDEKELNYYVDAKDLIDDTELALWRDEGELLQAQPKSKIELCLYEMHVVPDCL